MTQLEAQGFFAPEGDSLVVVAEQWRLARRLSLALRFASASAWPGGRGSQTPEVAFQETRLELQDLSCLRNRREVSCHIFLIK